MNEKISFWDRLMKKPEQKPSSFAAMRRCICLYRDGKHYWLKETEEREKCFFCGQVRVK
jgi:hypothetical protein